MSFRGRLLLAFGGLAGIPVTVIMLGVRHEMNRRLGAEYQARVSTLALITESALARERGTLEARLASVHDAVAADNRFRLAVMDGARDERPYLLDYAGRAMRLTGLSMLQIQDANGRILSSGHFRNEYDRLEPDLAPLFAATPGGTALLEARTPDGPVMVLARLDSLRMGGRRFTIVGGIDVGPELLRHLAPSDDFSVALTLPSGAAAGLTPPGQAGLTAVSSADDEVVAAVPVAFIGPEAGGSRAVQGARFVVVHPGAALRALRTSVDRWFVWVGLFTAAVSLVAGAWLAARVSRPLRGLAQRTARVDLDRLDVEFSSDRTDEIGVLSRVLAAMVGRLRVSAVRVREAERRATVGDLARQVNHDVKNGLVPLRHVLRHLAQVARDDPEQLATVFGERRPTLEASVSYLDGLARRYGRLTPRLEIGSCDVNAVARAVAAGAAADRRTAVVLRLDAELPHIVADIVVLRRILENLVANAVDALGARGGSVTIETTLVAGGAVRVAVADTGRGMESTELARAFDDFFTTKPGGTGLGLCIVRRLATDLDATLGVESVPGTGTRVLVTFPPPSVTSAAGTRPAALSSA